MRTAILVALIGALALTAASCSTFTSYDETDPVKIKVNADARLNDYSGEPHALVVYAYKVDDPDLFRGADENSLIADVGKQVTGGVVHQIRTFSPGDSDIDWRVGEMGQQKYRWVGIYAAYRDGSGSRRVCEEIPSNGEFRLDFGAKGIEAFGEKD